MRLIDADMLKKELAISGSCNNCKYKGIFGCREDILVGIVCSCIHEAPTVDAVPVVRCKDCRFYLQSYEKCELIDTRLRFYETDKTWTEDCFCTWGERRCEDDH